MTLITFIGFTLFVAIATWWLTRNKETGTQEGYFLAGRSLSGLVIAGSLLLTNLSTEQLVGLNGGAFSDGLSVMCWEVIAGCSLVVMALFFLPRYLKSGIATIPQFLEERYGRGVRAHTTTVFIVAYTLILLPFVLYSGATALSSMLQLPEMLGMSERGVIWMVVGFIAIVGSGYAVFGGLRAVAVSDLFNGIGLLVGGFLITWFTIRYVAGDSGSFVGVFKKVSAANPDAFVSLGKEGEGTHWPTLFTGVLLLNFFYWCTNQQIIQRTFGAKTLAEGQKGVLLAAFFKILAPLILVVPGILALHIANENAAFNATILGADGVRDGSLVYGSLVRLVLPPALTGFFAAVLVGSILSTFNSVLNSSATLFSLGVYQKMKPKAGHKEIVRSGMICSAVVAVFSAVSAPIIFFGQDKIFEYFQSLNGVYFIPLLAIILVGMFNRRVNGRSALITACLGLVVMLWGSFFDGTVKVNPEQGIEAVDGWVASIFGSGFHFMGAVFLGLILLQLALGYAAGMLRKELYVQQDAKVVDLTPWRPAPYVGGVLIISVLSLYLFLA